MEEMVAILEEKQRAETEAIVAKAKAEAAAAE